MLPKGVCQDVRTVLYYFIYNLIQYLFHLSSNTTHHITPFSTSSTQTQYVFTPKDLPPTNTSPKNPLPTRTTTTTTILLPTAPTNPPPSRVLPKNHAPPILLSVIANAKRNVGSCNGAMMVILVVMPKYQVEVPIKSREVPVATIITRSQAVR